MPASILTEAMAQAGAVLILSKPENRSRLVYFMGIDRVRYRQPGRGRRPGDARVRGAAPAQQDGQPRGPRPGGREGRVRRPDDVRPRRPAGPGLRPAGAVSLARALSKFGVASRREAERWIADGRVRVNGAVERRRPAGSTRPATGSSWTAGGSATTRRGVVIALHKPRGLVTTRADPGGRPTVYDALGDLGRVGLPGRPARPRHLGAPRPDERPPPRRAPHVPRAPRPEDLPRARRGRSRRRGPPRAARGPAARRRHADAAGEGAGPRDRARGRGPGVVAGGPGLDLARDRPHRGQEPPGPPDGRGGRARGPRARARAHRAARPRRSGPRRVAGARAGGGAARLLRVS